MPDLKRLDAELVRRKIARSREAAVALIESGVVKVDGVVSTKPARMVDINISIIVTQNTDEWVSRGAHKLIGALDAFSSQGLNIGSKNVLDAGASTGGFTQVCLSRGAESVVAVDVGYGQLAWELRTDKRVHCMERFNVRELTREDLPHDIDFVVADLSFISLKTVLPALSRSVVSGAQLLLMVKPQFEVGRESVGDGVVLDPELRLSSVMGVIEAGQSLGSGLQGVTASPLPGPSGNVEYFVWFTAGESARDLEECRSMVQRAVEEGPQ